MKERIIELRQVRTKEDYDAFIANQFEKWRNLEDPSEPKEVKSGLSNHTLVQVDNNMDEEMFVALRTQLGS